LTFLRPKRIAIADGYHGTHHVISIYQKTRGDLEVIDLEDRFQAGDVCWLETPLNPTGEARSVVRWISELFYPLYLHHAEISNTMQTR